MRVYLRTDSGRINPRQPYDHADHVLVDGACPHCAAAPFKVSGTGRRIASHDTYEADAVALCCRKSVGTLEAVMSTIFGLEEDERVLYGRARIY